MEWMIVCLLCSTKPISDAQANRVQEQHWRPCPHVNDVSLIVRTAVITLWRHISSIQDWSCVAISSNWWCGERYHWRRLNAVQTQFHLVFWSAASAASQSPRSYLDTTHAGMQCFNYHYARFWYCIVRAQLAGVGELPPCCFWHHCSGCGTASLVCIAVYIAVHIAVYIAVYAVLSQGNTSSYRVRNAATGLIFVVWDRTAVLSHLYSRSIWSKIKTSIWLSSYRSTECRVREQ